MPEVNPDLERMAEDGDTGGLIRVLHGHPDSAVRAKAAKILAGLDSVDLVEELIRASLGDEDDAVRRAARNALEQRLGKPIAGQAIDAYGPLDEDEEDDPDWEESAEDPDGEPAEALFAAMGREALETILSGNPRTAYRLRAVKALGSLGSQRSVEALICAVKADPDPEVQAEARQALEVILGAGTAGAAIDSYGEIDVETYQDNLVPDGNETKEVAAGSEGEDAVTLISGSSGWTDGQIRALTGVLTDDRDPEKQLKALDILTSQPSMTAIDAISWVALYSEHSKVRKAAHAALQDVYGDETEDFLSDFRAANAPAQRDDPFQVIVDGRTGEPLEDEDEDEDEEEEEDVEEENAVLLYGPSDSQPKVIQEEPGSRLLPVALGLLFLALLFLAARLLLH